MKSDFVLQAKKIPAGNDRDLMWFRQAQPPGN